MTLVLLRVVKNPILLTLGGFSPTLPPQNTGISKNQSQQYLGDNSLQVMLTHMHVADWTVAENIVRIVSNIQRHSSHSLPSRETPHQVRGMNVGNFFLNAYFRQSVWVRHWECIAPSCGQH